MRHLCWPPRGRWWLCQWLALALALGRSAAQYEKNLDPPKDRMLDDHTDAVARLRARIADAKKDNVTFGGKYGVVMIARPATASDHSELTIPIWREYCRRHKIGFFLQTERLNTDFGHEWSKPRALIELLPKVRWRYLLLVDPDMIPVNLDLHWNFLVKQYMRVKRYYNDDVENRFIWCPQECDDDENLNPVMDGACTTTFISGCTFWSKKKQTLKLVKHWYHNRLDEDLPDGSLKLIKGFKKLTETFYDEVLLKGNVNISKHVGAPYSSFLRRFGWTEENKWDLKQTIHTFIKKNKVLSEVSNAQHKEEEEAEARLARKAKEDL